MELRLQVKGARKVTVTFKTPDGDEIESQEVLFIVKKINISLELYTILIVDKERSFFYSDNFGIVFFLLFFSRVW